MVTHLHTYIQIILLMDDGVYVNGEKVASNGADLSGTILASLGMDGAMLTKEQQGQVELLLKKAAQLQKCVDIVYICPNL